MKKISQTDKKGGAGRRLKTLLAHLKMNQDELARKYGCKAPYISKIVNGHTRLSQKLAVWLAHEYGVNLTWIYAGVGQMLQRGIQATRVAEVPATYLTKDETFSQIRGMLRLATSHKDPTQLILVMPAGILIGEVKWQRHVTTQSTKQEKKGDENE